MSGVLFVSEARLTGYGVAGREYLRALHRAGVPVRWLPLVPGRWRGLPLRPDAQARVTDDPELAPLITARVAVDRVVVHAVPEFFAPVFEAHPGRRRLGVTVWETDRLPRAWPALLAPDRVDRLVVPTAWNRAVFRAALPALDLRVAPHILEDPPATAPATPTPDAGVVFYTIGEWVDRKNLVGTVAAFLRAFRARDPVRLVVKTGDRDQGRRPNPHPLARAARRLRSAAVRRGLVHLAETHAPLRRLRSSWEAPPPIELHPEPWPRARVAALHARGDCFFSLTHGEGWGLGAFEAAAAGNDVVTTSFGGPLAWLPEGHAGLVPQHLVPVRSVMGSYTPDQRWAEPDVDAAIARLRAVAADPAAARARGEAARAHVRARFGHAEAGPAFVRAIMDDARPPEPAP